MDPSSESHFVLVVDDDEDIRETMRDVVEAAGCTVRLAPNVTEAMHLLQTRVPCLVIVDLVMPGMTGADLIAAMRNDERLAATQVILCTSAPHRAPEGIPVLRKPVDVSTLLERIRGCCQCV